MGICGRSGLGVVCLLAAIGVAAQVTPIPRADELSGRPYSVQKKWVIGGVGDWDYLTVDPVAQRLFVAHGRAVQVVDIETGEVAGKIGGFQQAHAIVLDDTGAFGYATDGGSRPIRSSDLGHSEPVDLANRPQHSLFGQVRIFDRRTFQVAASVLTRSSLRALTFEPRTGLLFAAGTDQETVPPPEPTAGVHRPAHTSPHIDPPAPPPPAGPCNPYSVSWNDHIPESLISVIDPENRLELAEIRFCGLLTGIQADGEGGVWVNIPTSNRTVRLDAAGILDALGSTSEASQGSVKEIYEGVYFRPDVPELDWRIDDEIPQIRTIHLGDCNEPQGLALDNANHRLFVACSNMKMAVFDSLGGTPVASFTVGPGSDAIAYDAGRGLIFIANGGGYGSLTVVRQHLTDSYAVIQNLPTMEKARTMAIDPSTGLVYLVTTLYGADLRHPPRNGIGTLKLNSVNGSFQVLVVGN